LYKEVSYLNTGFTSSEKNWDEGNERSKSTHPKFKIIIKKIQDLSDDINFEIKLNLKNGIDVFSLSEIKNKIKSPIQKSNKIKTLELYESHITKLENEGRIGYAKVFCSSRDNFKKFMNKADKSFIAFSKEDFKN